MPPIDAKTPIELSQPPQSPQQITSEILLRAAQPDGTAVVKPKLPQTGENVPSDGGTSAKATTRGEESLKFAKSIDYARDNFARIDLDNDGRLSLGEVQGAMRKAEGTADEGKLGAVFSNFEKLSKTADFSLFDSFKTGIDMQDLNLQYQISANRGFTARNGNPASEAMHRHQLYRDTHDGKLPIDNVHEASAWLLSNMKKYDSSRDSVLNREEILNGLKKETDPKARQMLQVLSENYHKLKKDGDIKTWLVGDGISLYDAQDALVEIEQKRGAYDISHALLANGGQLFNALDRAKNGIQDSNISINDLKEYLSKYEELANDGGESGSLYSPKNVSLVREMLGQWQTSFNTGSPLARLTGLTYATSGPTLGGSIKLESVRSALKM